MPVRWTGSQETGGSSDLSEKGIVWAPTCFLADEVVIPALSPMSLRRADPRRRQDPEA